MQSKFSFKKKNQTPSIDSNIYFGCPDFDFVLNYCISRSSQIILEEDCKTNHHISLQRYFLGYGLQKEQKAAVYDTIIQKWSKLIPKIIDKKKLEEVKKKKENINEKNQKSAIAWRYDKMQIKFKSFSARSDYNFLDLSKNEAIQSTKKDINEDQQNNSVLENLTLKDLDKFSSLQNLYLDIENTIQDLLDSPNDVTPKRIVINGLGSLSNSYFYSGSNPEKTICQFFNALKTQLRSTHCVIIISIPSHMYRKVTSDSESNTFRNKVLSYCDLGISIESLHNSKMFRDFSGVLNFMKISPLLRFKQYPLEHDVYGFKAGKTEFEVELLYENSLGHTEQNTSDTKKSTGICQPKKNDLLDF